MQHGNHLFEGDVPDHQHIQITHMPFRAAGYRTVDKRQADVTGQGCERVAQHVHHPGGFLQ